MIEMERVTRDGLFTVTIRLNGETPSYPPESIVEICELMEQTASSLRFALEHPEVEMPSLSMLPS